MEADEDLPVPDQHPFPLDARKYFMYRGRHSSSVERSLHQNASGSVPAGNYIRKGQAACTHVIYDHQQPKWASEPACCLCLALRTLMISINPVMCASAHRVAVGSNGDNLGDLDDIAQPDELVGQFRFAIKLFNAMRQVAEIGDGACQAL